MLATPIFMRDVWIRTRSIAVASGRANNLATHPSLSEWLEANNCEKKGGRFWLIIFFVFATFYCALEFLIF